MPDDTVRYDSGDFDPNNPNNGSSKGNSGQPPNNGGQVVPNGKNNLRKSRRMTAADRFWRKGGGKRQSLNDLLGPGTKVLGGLCTIIKNIGSGGFGNVYEVETDLWEISRHLMLAGIIEDPNIGITSGDIENGGALTPVQVQKVNQKIDMCRQLAEANGTGVPQEFLNYIHPKLRSSKRAAMKVLDPMQLASLASGVDADDHLKRFEQEEYLMRRVLDHENIIKVYLPKLQEIDEHGDAVFHAILEELVEDATSLDRAPLAALDPPLSNEEAVFITHETFKAVCHSHDQHVVWRDCAPKNVVWNRKQRKVRATDWGIARPLSRGKYMVGPGQTTSRDISITVSGTTVATPAYASPEQIWDPKTVDFPSDYWSLGVMLYELTTKSLPFVGRTYQDVTSKIASFDPDYDPLFPNQVIASKIENAKNVGRNPSLWPKKISVELEDLIMMLLDKTEARRLPRKHVAEMFDYIIKNGIYEEETKTPEAERKELEAAAAQIEKAQALEAANPQPNLKQAYDIARSYDEAGRSIPRQLLDSTIPDFSREEAFRKALRYYSMVLKNFDAQKIGGSVGQDVIEDAISLLESRILCEKKRSDQYVLQKRTEKQKQEALFAELQNKPGLGSMLIGGWGRWRAKAKDWADRVLDTAESFMKSSKYKAARETLNPVKEFLTENKDNLANIAADLYGRFDTLKDAITREKSIFQVKSTIENGIGYIKKSIRRKRFPSAKDKIDAIKEYTEQNIQEQQQKGFDIQKLFDSYLVELKELETFNSVTESEYNKYNGLCSNASDFGKAMDEREEGLSQDRFFPRAELAAAKENLAALRKSYESLDSALIRQKDREDLGSRIKDLEGSKEEGKECGRIDALSKSLSAATYEWAVKKVDELGKSAESIDKYDSEKDAKVSEAKTIFDALSGGTGIPNIDESHIGKEKMDKLRRDFAEKKKKFEEAKDEVEDFERLIAKTASPDINEQAAARCLLAAGYLKDKADFTAAHLYFDKIPASVISAGVEGKQVLSSQLKAVKDLLDTHKRVSEPANRVKRTRYGLDEKVIKRFELIYKDYHLYSSHRDDDAFDVHLKDLCGYIQESSTCADGGVPTYESFEKITGIRRELDRVLKETLAGKPKGGQQESKPKKDIGPKQDMEETAVMSRAESAKSPYDTDYNPQERMHELLAEFAASVSTVVEKARKMLRADGFDQPSRPEDLLSLGQYLENLGRADAAVEYFRKYSRTLPEGSDGYEEITGRIRVIEQNQKEQKK